MSHQSQESSVMFSLEELTKLEEERIEQEARKRAAAAARVAQDQRNAERRAQAAEDARVAAEAAEREQQAQREAEEAARLAGIAQAELEQARARQQAQATLEAREAQLRHERELVKLRYQRSHKWTRLAVAAGAAVILGIGGLVGVRAMADPGPTDPTMAAQVKQLKEERRRLLNDRRSELERIFRTQRSELERIGTLPAGLDQARVAALDAHLDVARHGVDDQRLSAFADAVLALSVALEQHHHQQQLAELDQIHAKLRATVTKLRRPGPGVTKAAARAAAARRAIAADRPDARMIATFDKTLTLLALAVAGPAPSTSAPASTGGTPSGGQETCQDIHDPLCGKLPGGS